MADLRIVDAPEIPTENITGEEKIPTGGNGNYSISLDSLADYTKTKKDLADNTSVDGKVNGVRQELDAHIEDLLNPHQVTKGQIGLGNVDNTADADKPVSNSTQSAIISAVAPKADKTYVDNQLTFKANKVDVYTKQESSDLVNNSISTALTPVNTALDLAKRGIANRYDSSLTYNSGERVVLTNGDIVKSTIDGNANDPNVDMTGWVKTNAASQIVDASGRTQQQINNNTAYFYHTVSEMVADENLVDGVIVGTKGYHNIFDDGGAIYLISSIATDYSIPLANGLHAVFRDSFDIRKFGIRNNASLDQTEYFQRLVNYSDSRVYEIDFHNYEFMTPKIWTWIASRGVLANQTTPITNNPSQVMGLPFHYCHKLKNLKIVNDKTTRLNTSHCQIVFAPLDNPLNDEWFEIENAVFDPWVDNFQPHSESYLGAYDGMRHGFFCHPAKDSTIEQWASTPTNINFRFKNIHFKSPAYSYNLTPSAMFAKRVEAYGLTGEYLALYLNFYAENLDVDGVDGVYRADLKESARNIVTNAIHFEPEISIKPNVKFDTFSVKRAKSKHYITGDAHWTFKIHALGTGHTLNKLKVEDVNGMVQAYASVKDNFIISKFDAVNSIDVNLALGTTVNHLHMQNFGLRTVGQRMLSGGGKVLKITGDNIDFYTPLAIDADAGFTVSEIDLTNIRVYQSAVGLVQHASSVITKITLDGVKVMSGNVSGSVVRVGYNVLKMNNVSNGDESGVTIAGVIQQMAAEKAKTYLSNFNFTVPNNSGGGYLVDGRTDVVISNSNFVSKPVFQNLGDGAVTKRGVYYNGSEASKTYDPPSIAASGVVTTTVTVQGVVIGDTVKAAFSQYNADIEISESVSSANTVTVKFKNTGAAAVDLSSGTLTVKVL